MIHLAGFLQEALEKQVQREAYAEYWANLETPKPIKVEKSKIIRNSPGWWNLVSTTLKEIRP